MNPKPFDGIDIEPSDVIRHFVVQSMGMSRLSVLTLALALISAGSGILWLKNPVKSAEFLRKLPRSLIVGYITIAIATIWYLIYLHTETMADFSPYRRPLTVFFLGLALGVTLYVRDFLAVRGLAIIMLLLAKLMVDTARWHSSNWRLLIIGWAYVLVILGMWFTLSPWRFRDLIEWVTKTQTRFRAVAYVRVAFGIFLVILALTAFRNP